MRARDLGVVIGDLEPGARNAISDVAGVLVGHTTLIEGSDVRTGVTVVIPADEAVFAGAHRLNGNGELTGLEWIRESGLLETPIGLTNTHSVGVVRDALVAAAVSRPDPPDWSLPVVGETWDGRLNDVNGFHVRPEHVEQALAAASTDVAEGNVGGGTGMVCHGFKGGIGTASRVTGAGHTVGVLVQANHGRRARLQIDGVPVGKELSHDRIPMPTDAPAGSIIVLVATDAPLLPHQCERLAHRASFGIARTGGAGENTSGDLLLAWATGNRGLTSRPVARVDMLANDEIDPLFYAAIEATEEAIVNAMVAAETMTGCGVTVERLDHEALGEAMARYGRRA
jgi:D-aminopeptidase